MVPGNRESRMKQFVYDTILHELPDNGGAGPRYRRLAEARFAAWNGVRP